MQGVEKIIKNDNSKNQIFNITHGNGRAINEIIEILKKNFKDLKIEFKQRDKLMPERGTLSIDKAKKLINYEPKWKIEDGYQKYIDWYKNFESKLMSFKELIKKHFIVAEIGNNHEGNFKTAIKLIDKASAKVDAESFNLMILKVIYLLKSIKLE